MIQRSQIPHGVVSGACQQETLNTERVSTPVLLELKCLGQSCSLGSSKPFGLKVLHCVMRVSNCGCHHDNHVMHPCHNRLIVRKWDNCVVNPFQGEGIKKNLY